MKLRQKVPLYNSLRLLVVGVALVAVGLQRPPTSHAAPVRPGPASLRGWSSPLERTDIGNPAISGSVKSSHGVLEIVAGGKDVWGNSDEFTFVHQQMTGDFDVKVRAESLTAAQP